MVDTPDDDLFDPHGDDKGGDRSTVDPVIRLSKSERRSIVLGGIFLLISVFMIRYASSLLIPVTVAVLLFLLMYRPLRNLSDFGIPPAIGAILGVGLVAAALFGIVYLLSGPAQEWVERIPQSFYKIEQKLRPFKEPIEQTEKALRKVGEAADIEAEPGVQKVEIQTPGYLQNLFASTPQVFASVGSTLLLLLFLLASGDIFIRKLVSVSPTLTDKKKSIEITRMIQDDISYYLWTVLMLNVTAGVLLALYCFVIGVQDVALWGSLAAVLGFVPFVGPTAMAGLLAIVGMVEFESPSLAASVPGFYLVIVVILNSFLLPVILGRRLTLNPVAIFLAIMFWGWAWGVIGILLAVPILASVKILCERIESLQPFSEFLTP